MIYELLFIIIKRCTFNCQKWNFRTPFPNRAIVVISQNKMTLEGAIAKGNSTFKSTLKSLTLSMLDKLMTR